VGQVARSGHENGVQALNTLLIVVAIQLAVNIGLLCYAAHLLDTIQNLKEKP
jgi:hypothetical protein